MRKLEEHFCTFEQTQKLMSFGLIGIEHLKHITPSNEILYQLSESCLGAILRSQALDFFRELGYTFNSCIISNGNKFAYDCLNRFGDYISESFDLPHESESALIDKLIEIQMEVQNESK